MTHTYSITGMTCGNCEASVKSKLLSIPGVTVVEVSRVNGQAIITMDGHIPLDKLQEAMGGSEGKYQISAESHNEFTEQTKSWLNTYKPLLLLFFYITFISTLAVWVYNYPLHGGMSIFMALFFLSFSFFKFLDLKSFAESYMMYDIVAQRWKAYGFIYPFIEFALGIAYLIQYNPVITNVIAILVMGISSIGVIRSVLIKQKIKCACLGAVFNLPMSTVTIVEDTMMVGMAAMALIIKM